MAAAAGHADADDLRTRPAFLLPPDEAHEFVSQSATGMYTRPGFFATFLQAPLAAGGAAALAVAPLAEWFRVSSTNTGGGDCIIRVQPTIPATPIQLQGLNRHTDRFKALELARIGVGGPALSTAAFNAGIAQVTTTLNDTATRQLDYQRSRADRSFTDKHGEQLAERMHRLTGAADDDHLPEVHRLLAKSGNKSRDYGILSSMILERVRVSTVPLSAANAPLPTTKLVDEVFRSFLPSGTGLNFAQGLSPFSVVCDGHAEQDVVRKLVKQAELAESGSHLSLADAHTLTATDVRFATEPQVAAEKLYGWSILVDLFHGGTHDIANSVRTFVIFVGPILHQIFARCADTPAKGMDLVNRVLFEAQQDYFAYCTERANGGAPAVPTFASIQSKVTTYRADSLSPLPSSWYALINAPERRRPGATNPAPGSSQEHSGAAPAFNAYADRLLMSRFAESGHSNITAMTRGHDVEFPKHGGKDVCLMWALKGECSSGCKRKANHVRYPRVVNDKIHQLMTTCGVANPPE